MGVRKELEKLGQQGMEGESAQRVGFEGLSALAVPLKRVLFGSDRNTPF
jgi:hypothetical protein